MWGDIRVGGVAGSSNCSKVVDCYNAGSVSGSHFVGGVTGNNQTSSIVNNSYNGGSVVGRDYVGGVTGYNDVGSTIINCYNTEEVSANNFVGGIVGNNSTSSIVSNCYSTNSVSAIEGNVGGVVGYNKNSITNCYNSGDVSGSRSQGGVVGSNNPVDDATVSNNYYRTRCGDTSNEGTEMSDSELKSSEFTTSLNNSATTYNEQYPSYSACAWVAVANNYPTLDFDSEPSVE